MRVSVSGKQFIFPRSCACCGGYPLTTLPVSGAEANRKARTKGWVWDIPYCVECKKHIRAAEKVLVGSLLLTGVGCGFAFAWALAMQQWRPGMSLLVFLVLTGSLACWTLWRYIRFRRPVHCTAMTRAITYIGAMGTCHTFEIKSGFYAAEFVRANRHKIVNASARVASILRNTGLRDYQVPRRLVRSKP